MICKTPTLVRLKTKFLIFSGRYEEIWKRGANFKLKLLTYNKRVVSYRLHLLLRELVGSRSLLEPLAGSNLQLFAKGSLTINKTTITAIIFSLVWVVSENPIEDWTTMRDLQVFEQLCADHGQAKLKRIVATTPLLQA